MVEAKTNPSEEETKALLEAAQTEDNVPGEGGDATKKKKKRNKKK